MVSRMLDRATTPNVGDAERDTDLLQQVRGGHAPALKALMDRHWAPLVTYAARLLQSWDAAEDVTQEAFVRVWERRESWNPTGSVQGLLYRMVRNLALDARKAGERAHRRAEQAVPVSGLSPAPTPLDVVSATELEEALRRAVGTLSERRREVYELARLEGLSYQDIGEVLDIAPQTVANHLCAAIAQLRTQLADHLEVGGAYTGPSAQGGSA
jgi:RNA polymerase sigma-70 factor (family 1)